MAIKVKVKDKNRMPEVLRELQFINGHKVQVGVFGEEDSWIVMVASVHEFGATIRPKRAKALTIPLKPEVRDKRARDIPGIFRLKASKDSNEKGNILARKKGKGIEALFFLAKKVVIPERSFLRSTFDEEKPKIDNMVQKMLVQVYAGKMTGEQLLNRLGLYLQSRVQAKIRSIKSPPKSGLTMAAEGPGKTKPLLDTGRLLQSITYQVV